MDNLYEFSGTSEASQQSESLTNAHGNPTESQYENFLFAVDEQLYGQPDYMSTEPSFSTGGFEAGPTSSPYATGLAHTNVTMQWQSPSTLTSGSSLSRFLPYYDSPNVMSTQQSPLISGTAYTSSYTDDSSLRGITPDDETTADFVSCTHTYIGGPTMHTSYPAQYFSDQRTGFTAQQSPWQSNTASDDLTPACSADTIYTQAQDFQQNSPSSARNALSGSPVNSLAEPEQPASVNTEPDSTGSEDQNDSTSTPCWAELIYRCLKQAHVEGKPRYTMEVSKIYKWVSEHSPKGKKLSENSIRHNLSLNGAFVSLKQIGKGWWGLAPCAITDGIVSTTRYRKDAKRKSTRIATPATSRKDAGAKGVSVTRAARRQRKLKYDASIMAIGDADSQLVVTCDQRVEPARKPPAGSSSSLPILSQWDKQAEVPAAMTPYCLGANASSTSVMLPASSHVQFAECDVAENVAWHASPHGYVPFEAVTCMSDESYWLSENDTYRLSQYNLSGLP